MKLGCSSFQIQTVTPRMHHKGKMNYWYCRQNNQWKITGEQLLIKSPIELELFRQKIFVRVLRSVLWSRRRGHCFPRVTNDVSTGSTTGLVLHMKMSGRWSSKMMPLWIRFNFILEYWIWRRTYCSIWTCISVSKTQKSVPQIWVRLLQSGWQDDRSLIHGNLRPCSVLATCPIMSVTRSKYSGHFATCMFTP